MALRALVVLSFLLPPFASAAAQSTNLRGAVRDSANRPLADVEVTVQESPVRAVTDARGRFELRGLQGDSAHLSLRRVGYRPLSTAVTLVGEGLPAVSLVLAAEQHVLPELITTGRITKPVKYAATVKYDDFFRRRKLGLGTFIDRDQIEKMNAFHTLEILRGIPGVSVDIGNPGDPATASIVIPRCQEGASRALGLVSVFIDGRRVLPTSNRFSPNRGHRGEGTYRLAELLSRISAPGIELVEVYRGLSQIPAEFYEVNACGAIAIWTRYHRETPSRVAKRSTPPPG